MAGTIQEQSRSLGKLGVPSVNSVETGTDVQGGEGAQTTDLPGELLRGPLGSLPALGLGLGTVTW